MEFNKQIVTKRKEHTPFYFNEEVDQALRECDDARVNRLRVAKFLAPIPKPEIVEIKL